MKIKSSEIEVHGTMAKLGSPAGWGKVGKTWVAWATCARTVEKDDVTHEEISYTEIKEFNSEAAAVAAARQYDIQARFSGAHGSGCVIGAEFGLEGNS